MDVEEAVSRDVEVAGRGEVRIRDEPVDSGEPLQEPDEFRSVEFVGKRSGRWAQILGRSNTRLDSVGVS